MLQNITLFLIFYFIVSHLIMFMSFFPLQNMEEAFHSGYKDAVHFLQSNGESGASYKQRNKETKKQFFLTKLNLPNFLFNSFLSCSKLSQGPLSVNQNITWLHLETMKDEEEKKKLENGTTELTSFIDNGTIQMSDSTTQEAAQYPPLHFDTVKNGMF